MLPKTIDEVISALETIIQESIKDNSALGLFPALYKQVTVKVKEGIAKGDFENGPRMEKLDVVFASRYLAAYNAYQKGEEATKAWELAFKAAKDNHLILLQHLLIGMNAHINLDLGIAAAEIAYGDEIESLHHDFDQINLILNNLIEKVKNEIRSVSPMMYLVDWVMGDSEEVFAKFSMEAARDFAWSNAKRFAALPKEQWPEAITKLDTGVEKFGEFITKPGFLLGWIVKITKWMAVKDVRKQIKALNPAS